MKENGLDVLKKPPVPKNYATYNNFMKKGDNNVPLTSFLYGNKASANKN